MKYFIAIALLIIAGCNPKYTPTEALKDLNKANDYQPNTTKKWVNDKHPCFTDTKTDSSAYWSAKKEADSIYSLYQKEASKLPEIYYLEAKDTVDCIAICNDRLQKLKNDLALKESAIYQFKKQVDKLINNPIHDTVVDNRKLNASIAQNNELKEHIEKIEKKNAKLQSELDEMTEKRNWWRKICIITWAIIGLTVAARLYFKKPF